MPAPKLKRTPPPAQARARAAYQEVPKKTTADDPGHYSKTPHEYGDILIKPDKDGRTKLGGALQRDLVYWIERETWGKNIGSATRIVRPEYAKLSLTALAKLCGSDRRTVARSLADLAERGIIEARDRQGCGATVAKMYKLTQARWKTAKYYEPATGDATDEPEPEDQEADEPVPDANAGEALAAVDPRKVSKPQPVAWSPGKGAPAVTIRVLYQNVDLPFPVAFSSRPGPNGKLQISCRGTAPQRFAVSSPVVSPVSVDNSHVTSYRNWTSDFVMSFWGKALDEPLLESIVSAAAGAPVSAFERIVLARFTTSGSGKRHSTGLLIELAKDAARVWALQKLEKSIQTRTSPPPQLSPAELAEAEAHDAKAERHTAPCARCNGKQSIPGPWVNRGGVYGPQPVACPECGKAKKAAQ
jgi:hypothetical protein